MITSQFKQALKYYRTNLDLLLGEYYGRFLVIKNNTVIGVYENFDDAYSTTIKTEELGTFLIHRCVKTDEEEVFTYSGGVSFDTSDAL